MEISPEKWREASINGIKLAQTILEKSDRAVDEMRMTDPLPMLRDICVKQSNDRIRSYMRDTRAVVIQLRKTHAAVNDEMKSANRCKESLERALEHKRKDLALNQESQDIRSTRPSREKEPSDYADQLLTSEHSHLLSLKRSLEAHLRKVQLQLHELCAVRSRLAAVIQERSRVTDLLAQAINFEHQQGQHTTSTPREFRRQVSGISLRRQSSAATHSELEGGLARPLTRSSILDDNRPLTRSSCCGTPSSRPLTRSSLLDGRPLTRDSCMMMESPRSISSSMGGSRPVTRSSSMGSRQKAYSAPVPLELGRIEEGDEEGNEGGVVSPGPYSSVTVEAMQMVNLAAEAIQKSQEIRQQVASAIDHTQRLQQAAYDAVNENVIKKIAQTVTLTDHLGVSSGETKLSHHRSQRHYNAQQKALGYMLGPVSAADITTRERLDRPFVKVYQRHVGTDLPEAAHLLRATEAYQDSMDATAKNMALLKLASKSIKADMRDKKDAAFIDSEVVRLRRRKADHRWVLRGKAYQLKPQVMKTAIKSSSH